MSLPYDAIVVGSGATGGWAAMELTRHGLRVALLEAGPADPGPAPDGLHAGRQRIQARCYAYDERTAHLFVDDVENPYSTPDDAPFEWIRSRLLGGRLHVWGRTSVRVSDWDFKAASRDGLGEDWPISYVDLAPYYARVERFMRVTGVSAGAAQAPDGEFAPSPPLSSAERDFKARTERRWPNRTVTPARIAQRSPRGLIEAARATGRLTLRTDAVASRVLLDRRSGGVGGVAFVDRLTRREEEVAAPVVVLCASTIESTRLLLNSSTPEHPHGLGGSSGALGHYLMDHTFGVGVDGTAPWRWRPGGGASSHGCLLPCFRNVSERGADFARSYQIEMQVAAPAGGRLTRLRSRRSGRGWMRAFGEVLPSYGNHIALDHERPDAWGIPSVRISCRYGENERRMAADQHRCLIELAGASDWDIEVDESELSPPGLSAHELGTARMGSDPASSVLDANNQCWDVPNLFVTDGACFTSGGCQNPTLTMMALTARAADYIAGAAPRAAL